jgi:hypothetical protein
MSTERKLDDGIARRRREMQRMKKRRQKKQPEGRQILLFTQKQGDDSKGRYFGQSNKTGCIKTASKSPKEAVEGWDGRKRREAGPLLDHSGTGLEIELTRPANRMSRTHPRASAVQDPRR